MKEILKVFVICINGSWTLVRNDSNANHIQFDLLEDKVVKL